MRTLFSRVNSSAADFIQFISVQGNAVASLNGAEYNVFCIFLTEHGSNLNSNVFACVSLIHSQISVESILLSQQDKRQHDFHQFTKHSHSIALRY
jgi:hypothetical protein